MRIVYLDEAGTGNIEQDPILIVAGVVVHGDLQYFDLEDRLSRILERGTPSNLRVPSCLHAKDIYHGTREFHRDHWPRDARWALLDQLAALPRQLRLPIVWGAVRRQWFGETMLSKHPELARADLRRLTYAVAAATAIIQAEHYMRTQAPTREVASVVFELNSEMESKVRELHGFLRRPEVEHLPLERGPATACLPLRRIIDTPSFQRKTESSILQMADFCAFALKRTLSRAPEWERWFRPIEPQCMAFPSENRIPGGRPT